MPRALNFLAILAIVRQVLTLFPLPDWSVAESVRQWALDKFLPLCDGLADETEMEFDDLVVEKLKTVAADPAIFNSIYNTILNLIDGAGEAGELKVAGDDPRIKDLSDKVGIDPITIISIIGMIIQVINWWKNRDAVGCDGDCDGDCVTENID